jgi:hypothetical protein
MARCDVCGNDYRRTMEIHYQNMVGTFDSFEMRDPEDGAGVRALPLPDNRPRGRARRPHLLLRPLRGDGGRAAQRDQRLTRG